MCTYVIGLLRRGPNGSLGNHAMIHLDSLQRLSEPGAMIAAGRCLDGSDLRGLYIFAPETIEDVHALITTDPAIATVILRIDLHPLISKDRLQVGPPHDFLDVDV